ncbi:hypothetical protein [Bradyrhizobium erythrophlei]|jgi:hypothetical protein|uniref:Uncharacterized protein n=1 Tax=Bradyrhizobium erythrophlei TaxID=1437360 RepID=A0A1M7TSW8_9BRAD|nr:hypothetical protein [Bradyrhizobium erythrophlei]SHN73770.1 hypothetical protein SAMN05444170_2559 [Bradyrhizobium erythrophlei]
MTRILFASAALIAIAASQVAPAAAQVPAGLLRLDSSTRALEAQANLDQPKVRNTYAHVRKHHVAQ